MKELDSSAISVVQEVLGSIRVVKAFAREKYEKRRFKEVSLETVELALRARALAGLVKLSTTCAGHGATTRVAPTSFLRQHESNPTPADRFTPP